MKLPAEYYWWITSRYDDYDTCYARPWPKTAFCRGCHDVVRDWYPRRIEASLPIVQRAVEIRTSPGHVAVVHADLWRQLRRYCPSAIIGPVTIRQGDLDKFTLDWVTVIFPHDELIHVRGTLRSESVPVRGVCGVCGRQGYYASENPHLVRCQVPKDRPVFMDHVCKWVIAEPLAQRLDWSGFPDLVYERLPVLERPLDGLHLIGDPDWSTMTG
jgi:hypothetical protein